MNKGESAIFSQHVFETVRGMIRDYCGLYYDMDSYEMVSSRIHSRMNQLGIGDYSSYLSYLLESSSSAGELQELVEILSNKETYFFREHNQLDIMVDILLDDIIREKKLHKHARVKIFCAGCATGEEPYSIAILFLEKGLPEKIPIDILGIDISEKSIYKAKRGIYRQTSFRYMNPELRDKYFIPINDGDYMLADRVKNMVKFFSMNLLALNKPDLLGTADIIFCRNVIIYFDMGSRIRLINWCYNHLNQGGYLFLGHSESLLNMNTRFKDETINNEIIYRKEDPG